MKQKKMLAVLTWIGMAALIIANASTAQGQGLMVTGYADFEANWKGVNADNTNFFFDNHHVNLIMIGHITPDVFFASEVEYEHSGDEIGLEYGYFGYSGIKDLRLSAGKFLVPFGRFNKDLHPTFINKIPGAPLGFREVLPVGYSEPGVWVSGVRDFGVGARFVYDAFAINGLMGADGGAIRDMRGNIDESRTGTPDNNKAVGGRLGLELGPQGLDFGASIYTGDYSDDAARSLTLTMFDVDAAFRRSGFELRGELVTASQDATGGNLTKTGWYGQAAYRVQQWEPVVRYSQRRFSGGAFAGDDANDVDRLALGVNYHLTAASVMRAAYYINSEATGFDVDNNNVSLEWVVIF